MSVSVNNSPNIYQPVVEEISSQTETLSSDMQAIAMTMESLAACQGAALENIYNTPLCAEQSASDVAPDRVTCTSTRFTSGTVFDSYPPATYPNLNSVVREECSNGSITDILNFGGGDQQIIEVSAGEQPVPSIIFKDENCQDALTSVDTTCKPQSGPAFDPYYIPLVSDFGNQVYCVPNSIYAFAWSGVTNINIVDFLEQNNNAINLNDPTNKYVAVVNELPYACGGYNEATEMSVPGLSGEPLGVADNGLPYYAFGPGIFNVITDASTNPLTREIRAYRYLHTVTQPSVATEPNNPDPVTNPGTVAFVDGVPVEVPLHPLQAKQKARLGGVYSPVLGLCPGWEGDPPEPEPENPSAFDDLLDKLDPDCPEIKGKTQSEIYASLWLDWWKEQKSNSKIRNTILAVQGVGAAIALVESIKTYNKILDKNLDIICDQRDNINDLRACSAEMLEGEDGLIKTCQNNLLAGHNDRIGSINNTGQFACDFAANEVECYEKLWQPLQKEYTPKIADRLFSMVDNGKFSAQAMKNWSDMLGECVKENMLPELKAQFAPLLRSGGCVSANINDWRANLLSKAESLDTHYREVFKCNEATMIPEIMTMTSEMVRRVAELRDHLSDGAKHDRDHYLSAYQGGELKQSHAAMATSAEAIPRITESLSWLDTNIPAIKDIFDVCYAEEQRTLNPELFRSARELAPEVQACFAWFKERAECYSEFFDNCYKDRECRLVRQTLDMAIALIDRVEASIKQVDQWGDEDRSFHNENFRHVEALAMPDVVWNGNEASNDLDTFRTWWIDRSHEFQDIWKNSWYPCDLENLKQHCDVWSYTNPLREMHSNADQMKSLSLDTDEAYRYSVIEANDLLNEVFHAEPERFDYDLDDPAVLHVRQRVAQEQAALLKCIPKHAEGWRLELLARIKTEGARAEGAAYASSQRWKWIANQQLDRKQYGRKVELLQLFDSYGARTLAATQASTATYELMLRAMSDAIVRGDKFYAGMQDSGRAGISIMGNELTSMIQMIQQMHFWPELALRDKETFIRASHTTMDDAQQLVQLGRFWPEMASREKGNAQQISQSAVDVGMRLGQMGQFYLTSAENMNQQRSAQALSAGQLGNQYAQTGHAFNNSTAGRMQGALGSSLQAGQVGLGASEIGNRAAQTAMEIEARTLQNALQHMQASLNALQLGLQFMGEVRQTRDSSGQYGNNAAQSLLNLFRHGQQNGILANNANESCRNMEFEMLKQAKAFLQENFRVVQSSINGAAGSTLNPSNNLLNQQGNNAAGAFGLLGNSIEGILSSSENSTPPFPTGGFGQAGSGGGAGFGGLI